MNKKNGNIFKSSVHSISTAFDKNFNIIVKASQSFNNLKNKSKNKNK